MQDRAPRTKKRIACELLIDGGRYTGIALDVSASGLFVQTNVKPTAGARVEVLLTLPGLKERVVLDARVARKKTVPSQLLVASRGGIGLAVEKPPPAYLEFVAQVSPEQAVFAARGRPAPAPGSASAASGAARAAGTSVDPAAGAPTPSKQFRIHAVEKTSGRRNTYLAASGSEEAATAMVLEQLGDEWHVVFVERV